MSFQFLSVNVNPIMAYSDRTNVEMRTGPGPGSIKFN